MYIAKGKFCYIEELTNENIEDLFDMMKRNKDEFKFLISDQEIPDSFEEFKKWLEEFFTSDRAYQFIVYDKKDKNTRRCLGTFYFYNLDKENKNIKISLFIIPEFRKTLLAAEIMGLALEFANKILNVNELKFDVYKENKDMINLLLKIGLTPYSESRSFVNPERMILNYSINKDKLNEFQERFNEFKRRLRPR